jgi:hypothetical protein
MRRLALPAAAALLAAQPGFALAQMPCLSPGEFASITQYALPSALNGAAARCGPSLPSGAFLNTDVRAMAARYADSSRQAWPQAKAALVRLGNGMAGSGDKGAGEAALLAALPDPKMQQMLDGFVQGMVVARLPTNRCAPVDRLLELLAPLPAANTAGVVATVVGLIAEKKGAKLGPITICED